MKTNKYITALVSDTHWPEDHNPEAIEWFKDWVRKYRPHHVVHLGDMYNLTQLGRFLMPLKMAAGLKDSIQEARKLTADFDAFLRSYGVTWELVTGNHGDRLPKYLWRKAPELSDLDMFTLKNIMNIPKDVVVHGMNQSIQRNGVLLFHGTRAADNVVTYNFRYGMSVAQGHSHRLGMRHRRLPGDKVIRSLELGCLCNFNPEYQVSDLPDWAHGIGYIENGVLEYIGKD